VDKLAQTLGSLKEALGRLPVYEQKELMKLVVNRIDVGRMAIKIGLDVAFTASKPDLSDIENQDVFAERHDWLPCSNPLRNHHTSPS